MGGRSVVALWKGLPKMKGWISRSARFTVVGVLAAAVLVAILILRSDGRVAVASGAVESLPGCTTGSIAANDDGSSPAVDLGFSANFFGTAFTKLFVNNNGNVTFGAGLSAFTPQPIVSAGLKIIAPFWADVDTRGTGSQLVTYGQTQFNGRPAFCVNWVNVGYFSSHTDKLNSFQLILTGRADRGAGDFDIVMNYDKVQWETGDASSGSGGLGGHPVRMGYTNGDTVSFEYPGSNVSMAFLDSSPTGLSHNSRNSLVSGRYVFEVANGAPPIGGSISGRIMGEDGHGGPQTPVDGAVVAVCTDKCNTTVTNSQGEYSTTGLPAGLYLVYGFPPAGLLLQPNQSVPLTLNEGQNLTAPDLLLEAALPMPQNTTLSPARPLSGVVPLIPWNQSTTISETHTPGGGPIPWTITKDGAVIASGVLLETPPGSGVYTGAIPPLQPHHGFVHVHKDTPDGPEDFTIWLDPSGVVKTVGGAPIVGATVTLYRADTVGGPFTVVADGSAIMSPINRHNPDTTDAAGHFGWDVVAGFYKVRAEKAGCTAPDNAQQTYVDTAVLTIPPPVTDLELVLDCGAAASPTPAPRDVKWADADCDGSLLTRDGQAILRSVLQQAALSQTPPCFLVGSDVQVLGMGTKKWADADCDGNILARDSQAVLRVVLQQPPLSQTPPCPAVGTTAQIELTLAD